MKKREIKFRAFYKDLKIILENFSLCWDGKIGMHYDFFVNSIGSKYEADSGEVRTVLKNQGLDGGDLASSFLEGDDYIWLEDTQVDIMQFTGEKDILNVEIFEGDRVEEDGNKGTVIFQAGAFMIDWDMEDVLVDPIGFDKFNRPRQLKIIGTIFP